MSEDKPIADELSSNNDSEPPAPPTKGMFNRYSIRGFRAVDFYFQKPNHLMNA